MGLVIIYLYDSTVTDFTYNGRPLNKAYEVVVENTINDSFFVTFNHPLDDKGIYKIIEKDKIVKVHTPDGMQPFRIMDRVKYMDHISVEAWPLFYADMRNKLVKPIMIRGLTGQAAVNTFVNNLLIDTPFTFTSNIAEGHDYHTQDAEERENNPNQLYDALEVFKDIAKRWQGELVINGYDIRLVSRLGKNTGALLYEKKNISDFTDEESIQAITTRLYGKSEWTERPEGSNEEIKHEISAKVESPLIHAYSGIVFEKQYTNNDIRTEKEMKDWLNLKFTTDNIDKPSRNIKVGTNIVDDTVIDLGDSLVLKYVKHDVDMEIRMVGYTYDGYANRYIDIQLGDAKQTYVGSVQNTVKNIETNVNTSVKQTVNQILNANGERMIYSVNEPVGNFKNGDVWFDQQGGMYFWDEARGMWIDHPYNKNVNYIADKMANEIEPQIEQMTTSIAGADAKAKDALDKAGVNTNLIGEHKKTLDDITTITLPDINKSVSDTIKKANDAMTEAQKADGKIADYVTRNGLVSGTTVDSKINEATGEISKRITTVESKIPTEIGGRNLIANTELPSGYNGTYLNFGVMSSTYTGTTYRDTFTGQTTVIPKGEDYVVSFYAKASTNSEIVCHFYNPNSTTQAVSSTGQTSDKVDGGVNVSITTEWQRYWVRWKQSPTGTTSKKSLIVGRNSNVPSGTVVSVAGIKLEQGTIPSDWSPAPEDNYTQEEFRIFESAYNEDVKGIKSSLTDLSNKKLDGTTYTTFYNNEYSKTAQGVTDTYAKVNKIIDANGNSTDTFAKAVYDRNADRQKIDFQNVTKDLVTSATYTAGVKGITESISSVEGKIDNLNIGGTNLILNSGKPTDISNWTPKSSSYGELGFGKHSFWKNGTENLFRLSPTTDVEMTASSNQFYLKPDTEYTFSMMVFGDRNVSSFDVFLLYKFKGETAPWSGTLNTRDNTPNPGKADKFVWKFKTSNVGSLESAFIRIDHNGRKNTASASTLFYTNIKLEEGTVPTDWSPAPEDMLGQAEFNLFKRDYEATDKLVRERLTAVESTTKGHTTSINDVKKTADSNQTTIAKIKSSPTNEITGYQTIKERSDLYERVIGSSNEATVKQNVARIVMTDSIFQTEVIDKTNVDDSNMFSSSTTIKALTNMSNISRDENLAPNGFKATGANGGNGSFRLGGVITSNGWWTVSGWVRGSQNADISFTIDICESPSSKVFKTGTLNEWQYFEFSHNVTNYSPTYNFVDFNGIWWAYYFFKDIKVEKNHHATAWTPSAIDVATQSQITQLSGSWALTLKSGNDVKTAINATTDGIRLKGNLIYLDGSTSVNGDFWAKEVNAIKVNADNITTGTLDGARIRANSIDVNSLAGNRATLISAGLKSSSGGTLELSGDQLLSTASDKSQVYLQNGIVGTRNPNGATIGQIGYAYESSSPWYSMQVSHGSHFQIRMSRGAGELNKQAFYIISGGTESYLNTDNIYLNPASSGRVRVQGAMTVDNTLRTEGTFLLRSRMEFLNGGAIESQLASSNMLIASSNKLIIYSNGTNALEFDSASAVFRRKISENSDIRLKTNIVDMPINSLEAIRNIEIKKFDYLDGRTNYYGIIAQQAQQYLPELINTDNEGYLMVDKSAMTYVNMHAIQQVDRKVIDLEQKIDSTVAQLEFKIASLQEELAQLKGAA